MEQNQVHFVLQGKGGVGKSFISSILTQYFQKKTGGVRPFDTDPINDTLTQYQAFAVDRIDILDSGNNINSREFDVLVEKILASDQICVVDNGASTFVPLMAYMVENRVIQLLQQSGKRVYVHSVVTGGQAFGDTLQGLSVMLTEQEAPVVVWLNEFFGAIERDGKTFVQSALYLEYKSRIRGTVTLEKGNADTFGRDMEMLCKNKLTFDQALDSPLFGIMPRQRLKMVREAVYAQLDAVGFGNETT
jgi:hypothetical protein